MATKLRCPQCGKNTLSCRYVGDVGGPDWCLDEYRAHCSSCGFKKTEQISGSSPGGDEWITKCPFCGQDYPNHPI